MKYVRNIVAIGGSRYVCLPEGMFKEVKKVLMDIQFIRNDSSVTMRIIPYKGENGATELQEVTVKIPKENHGDKSSRL